jgi:hypothetical protein
LSKKRASSATPTREGDSRRPDLTVEREGPSTVN